MSLIQNPKSLSGNKNQTSTHGVDDVRLQTSQPNQSRNGPQNQLRQSVTGNSIVGQSGANKSVSKSGQFDANAFQEIMTKLQHAPNEQSLT